MAFFIPFALGGLALMGIGAKLQSDHDRRQAEAAEERRARERAVAAERRRQEAFINQLELGSEIGRGGFGVVYAATHKDTGERFAVKQVPVADFNPEELRFLSVNFTQHCEQLLRHGALA